MKYPAAYYLMLLYLTVIFRAVIPVVSDFISHNFEDAEHIATVHMLYGNDHVEKAMAESGKDTDGSKPQNTSKTESQITVHFAATNSFDAHAPGLIYTYLYTVANLEKPADIYLSTIAPPPKRC